MRLHAERTLADLSRFLLEEWDRLPQNRVQHLVQNRHRRCDCCVAAAGGPTCYCCKVHNKMISTIIMSALTLV